MRQPPDQRSHIEWRDDEFNPQPVEQAPEPEPEPVESALEPEPESVERAPESEHADE